MAENDLNLEWNVDVSDLSSISLDDMEDVLDSWDEELAVDINADSNSNPLWNQLNENVFLESGEEVKPKVYTEKEWDRLWSYLRWFFFSWVLSLLWIVAIVLAYSFDFYITNASQTTIETKNQEFVAKYKDKLWKLKSLIWMNNTENYTIPTVWAPQSKQFVNEIISASDIDYIEKKDLLSDYVKNLVRGAEDKANTAEKLRQDIAKQWFLPQELENLLSENETIDTIQRSLNALEIIKFSTATKVFSYMNTALTTILEMIKMNGVNVDTINQLFNQINWRWEKDITSYVYMCYLNPFEVSANCDTIWDLDLYYSITKDDSVNIKLFKNVMNAISQLLEKEDTTLFSITFKWFNAQSKNISFNIEVYTNQEDERNLMAQWKRNPNIFILTNIINLLKQSSFIIWADINTNEINVDTRTVNWWGLSRTVNYSSMDFTVPIQRSTEREIFDYIDLESIKKLLSDKWIKLSWWDINVAPEAKNNSEETNKSDDKLNNDSEKTVSDNANEITEETIKETTVEEWEVTEETKNDLENETVK